MVNTHYLEIHDSKPHGHKGEEGGVQNGNVLYGEGRTDLEIDWVSQKHSKAYFLASHHSYTWGNAI